jgi:predicted DNA-binding transcriptional regulator AlpA
MVKQILQIENTNNSDFITGMKAAFKSVLDEQKTSLLDEDILLTRQETSEMLSISLVTLWKYTKKDIIPAYRIGSKVRYKKLEILLALKKMNQFD